MKKFTILLTTALLGIASCNLSDLDTVPDEAVPVEELAPMKEIELTRAQSDFVKKGANAFALNLFKETVGDESMVVSPLCVTYALGMIDNGAIGNTKIQIEKALGYEEESLNCLNSFCETMIKNTVTVDPSANIGFANALIVNSRFNPLRREFQNTIEDRYSADISYMDFNADDVIGHINQWCAKKTNNMITALLKERPSELTYAQILSAIYFKGIWSSRFRKADSRKANFKDIHGKKQTVNMMRQKAYFNYKKVSNLCSAVCLPFGNQAFRMLFVLPEKGRTIAELKDSLTLEMWENICGGLYYENVDVMIPSFETEYASGLRVALQNLGVSDIFFPDIANLQAMTETDGVWLSDVIHKAKIAIDEHGSEAAAIADAIMATSIAPGPGPSQQPPAKEFKADRPFLYAIYEASTGSILFIGQYTG